MKNPTIIISNLAYITGLPEISVKKIRKLLTIDNPVFHQGISLGLTNWGVPQWLSFYHTLKDDNKSINVPVGALNDVLLTIREDCNIEPSDIIDNRFSKQLPDYFSNIKFSATLRDYQQDMVTACADKTVGVLEAMTGTGKTVFALGLILKLQQPTIFLVNTVELATQTIKSFAKFTNLNFEDFGFIGNGKFEVKPITVALHQTMSRLEESQFKLLNSQFGMIIADEVHIVAATTYYKTMTSLKARYKWGISATPKRDDGLTNAIFWATGPKIHTVPREKFESVLITPTYERLETEYRFPLIQSQDYQEMITDLGEDEERNTLICNTVKQYSDKMVVLLCLRLFQVEKLTNDLGEEAVMLTSKMKKKERALVMQQLLNSEKRIIVSTFALFSTGIDIPQLEMLFLCAPMRSEVKLRQSAGRLMRKSEGKTSAKIIDFVDVNNGLLANQARKRAKILTNL
jgi:superfamily II DNA or RNA helicase